MPNAEKRHRPRVLVSGKSQLAAYCKIARKISVASVKVFGTSRKNKLARVRVLQS